MHNISVSIVYATAEKQWLFEATVVRGTSAAELFEMANFRRDISDLAELDLSSVSLGVYAQKVDSDYLLEQGDRVEVYRSLKADPKEVRRQLAVLGKTIGKTKK